MVHGVNHWSCSPIALQSRINWQAGPEKMLFLFSSFLGLRNTHWSQLLFNKGLSQRLQSGPGGRSRPTQNWLIALPLDQLNGITCHLGCAMHVAPSSGSYKKSLEINSARRCSCTSMILWSFLLPLHTISSSWWLCCSDYTWRPEGKVDPMFVLSTRRLSLFFEKLFLTSPKIDNGYFIRRGDFNPLLNVTLDRSGETGVVNNFMDQCSLSDVGRFQFPHTRAYSSFSNVHCTYTRIDYFILDNRRLPKITTCSYTSIVISDHSVLYFDLALPNRPCPDRLSDEKF